MSKWKWVWHNETKLRDVGILADCTLHNPNGYPEGQVREAVLAAQARRHERRSKAAKKAGATRRRRTERRGYAVVGRMLRNDPVGPSARCVVCHRALGDEQSIARGIGSECWQDVLNAIEERRDADCPLQSVHTKKFS